MVVVEFSVEEMKKLVDISKDEMVDGLNNIGAPSEYEKETKKILAELTPNRPDWYSMEGLARSLKAYYKGRKTKYSAKKSDYVVNVDSVPKRQFTACAVVKGIAFNDERIRDMVLLQEKLNATLGRKVKKFGLGIYPLEGIRFPIRYTTMKKEDIRYVPLGYDREMSAKEILEEHKKGLQYGHLIRDMDKYPVFVDDEKKIMCLIPVVNSAETGKVGLDTKNIFIEVTGTDLNACKAALNILCCTFSDMGGIVYEVTVNYKKESIVTPELGERKMDLELGKVNRILGLNIMENEMVHLLSKMDYGYDGKVAIPPYRADIISDVDVIEDIAIAYGYNNFETTLPDFFSAGSKIDTYEEYDNAMRGMEFQEIKTFILSNREKAMGYDGELIEISNPNNAEFTVVRPNMLADIVEIFSNNKMKGLPQKYYEIGIVNEGEKRIVFGIMDKEVQFSDFRGYLQTLSRSAGFEFKLENSDSDVFEKDRAAKILINGDVRGILGKVNKEKLDRFGIEFEIYLCELKLG